MGANLSIESPNFEKIAEEAGNYTADAVGLLWAALNATRDDQRRGDRRAQDTMEPKVLVLAPTASVNDLDITGVSVVYFESGTQNFTGMRAPETGKSRVMLVLNGGAGTITAKHGATSETLNQLVNGSGADVTLATNAGIIYLYVASRWREVA